MASEFAKHSDHSALLEAGINVTTARNQIGMGAVLQHAQDSVQILRNDRTTTHAYVLGPKVLKNLFDEQIKALQEEVRALQASLEDSRAENRAAAARVNFLKAGNAFSPIKVEVPMPAGSTPAADIDI